jgi:hypothetical protein
MILTPKSPVRAEGSHSWPCVSRRRPLRIWAAPKPGPELTGSEPIPMVRMIAALLLVLAYAGSVATAQSSRGHPRLPSAQAIACLRSVEPGARIAHAYRKRGDRCEGFYAQPLGSSAFHLVGFGPRRSSTLAATSGVVDVSWAAPPHNHDTIYLRSEPRRPTTYYQMDTRTVGERHFAWRLEVAEAAGLTRQEFDVLCWMRLTVHGAREPVLIPCQLGRDSPSDASEIRVRTGQPVRSVTMEVSRMDSSGVMGAVRSLRLGGPYTRGHLLTLALEEFRMGGMYSLQLTAELLDGSRESSGNYWIRSRPPPFR